MGLPAPSTSESLCSPGAAHWLDVRVVYVRVSAPAMSSTQAPEKLTFRCLPRDIKSELEMNGARIPPSETADLALRLDRVDEDTSEAMYVSTDKIRLSSALPFAILHHDEQLAEGLMSSHEDQPPWAVGLDSRPSASPSLDWHSEQFFPVPEQHPSRPAEWGMRCLCTVSSNWSGFVIKSIQDFTTGQPVQPSLEVCVVGKCGGVSVMLTEQVQLLARKRSQWKAGLVAIPESEESDKAADGVLQPIGAPDVRSHYTEGQGKFHGREGHFFQSPHDGASIEHREPQQGSFLEGFWPTQAGLSNLYGDTDENGEMTWFNAGVRVGVGIGLGMCIGMGIGVGIIVKTYQATTRPFRGRLL